MPFYVYIIYSSSADKYYIGQTSDFEKRLDLHNAGLVRSTAPYRPWLLKCLLKKDSRSEAMILELKLKNLNRPKLIAFIKKYQ